MEKQILKIFALSCFVVSCSIDNYEQPDASLYGRVVDLETGEAIIQDIINGSQIQLVQLDYSDTPDSPRYLNFKTDGTFCENNMFDGTYEISVIKSNFGTFKDTITVHGKTKYDIKAKPNVTIENVEYAYNEEEGELKASFNLSSAGKYSLQDVAIVGGSKPSVTLGIKEFSVSTSDCAGVIDESRKYMITLMSDAVTDGKYYFRVAAKTEASDQYNYCSEASLQELNSSLIVEKGLLFDNCDDATGWVKGKLDANIKRKGNASITNTQNPSTGTQVYFQKTYQTPFDTQCAPENCVFSFYLYVDTQDINAFNKAKKGSIEFSSSGRSDKNEISFYWQGVKGAITMPDLSLGWNKVELPIVGTDYEGNAAKARMSTGTVDFQAINFVRIFLEKGNFGGEVTLKIDQIRVYDKTKEY